MTDDFEPAVESMDQPAVKQAMRAAPKPAQAEAGILTPEETLLACCLLDEGATLRKASTLTPAHFDDARARLAFTQLLRLQDSQQPITLVALVESLMQDGSLSRAGGPEYLMRLEVPTTTYASQYIQQIADRHDRRTLERVAQEALKQAKAGVNPQDIRDLLAAAAAAHTRSVSVSGMAARVPSSFGLPARNDPSILIGNRYLSRGDIGILASTSGVGKSSLSYQAACCWALGRPLLDGFAPNGPLKTLIFQAEDGDGDIAEVRLSMEVAMQLTDEEKQQVDKNVLIVTDRVHRGASFRSELMRQISLHHPDIVMINPLLAFMGGDVNDSTDVGLFIREQLNSLNDPPQFAYLIVHHTAKPPKEKQQRQWNEVMYEMAGSADLTNAARAIIALQATETPGEFILKVAKRGARAGLTKRVPVQGTPGLTQDTVALEVNIRHSTQRMQVNGQDLPVIHWERCEGTKAAAPKTGRTSAYHVDDFARFIPETADKAQPQQQIFARVTLSSDISRTGFKTFMFRAARDGEIMSIEKPGVGTCFYQAQRG